MIAPPALAAVAGTLVAAVIDARTGYIPNAVTRATALTALVLTLPGGLTRAALGACVAGGLLLALHLLTRGRGLGLGDVKLGAAIGAGLGPWCGIAALAAAFVTGGAYASYLIASGRASRRDAIAFGPFLTIGTWIAAFAAAWFAGGTFA